VPRRSDARRFPPPWSVEELDACFIVRDHNGQALAYVYFEDEPGRRSAAKLLSKDEARRIAADFADRLLSVSTRSVVQVLRPRVYVVRRVLLSRRFCPVC